MKIHQQKFAFNGDALEIFRLFKDKPRPFFLASSLRRAQARFSYIGFDPFMTVRQGGLPALKKAFDKYRLKRQALTFPAGAVGYLGYDGSLHFGFYDTILAVDHHKKQLIISSFSKARLKDILKSSPLKTIFSTTPALFRQPFPDFQKHNARFAGCVSESAMKAVGAGVVFKKGLQGLAFQSNFTKTGYLQAVRRVLEHIRRGDIYQINLSHKITVPVPGWQNSVEPVSIYKNLRQAFPSEFGAYLDDGRQVILSASPERFLKLHNGTAQVKPMKGTRPRGKTRAQDRKFKEELEHSAKEIAELLMVTDLERNDLGRVCDYASVKVTAMRAIETYKFVFQATSTVEGRLHKTFEQFDLLRAAFPSGSVTGCPKIEAMKIIEKLEHGPRGLYTGALGYISFSGDMDFNVMIRTMFLKPDEITFHVGGGIVADSKPLAEWQETWDKARPLMETLKRSFS